MQAFFQPTLMNMKTLLNRLLLVAFLAGAFTLNAQNHTKVGHVNVDELIMSMPETRAAQTELEKFAKSLEEDLMAMQSELEGKINNFRAKEKEMTDLTRETKYKEIQELDQRIQEYRTRAQEALQQKEVELLTPVLDKAQQAIVEVGKAGGYAYVLDSSQSKGVVIYLDGGHDLMKDVKTKLGIQ